MFTTRYFQFTLQVEFYVFFFLTHKHRWKWYIVIRNKTRPHATFNLYSLTQSDVCIRPTIAFIMDSEHWISIHFWYNSEILSLRTSSYPLVLPMHSSSTSIVSDLYKWHDKNNFLIGHICCRRWPSLSND